MFKISGIIQAKIGPKSVTSSQIFKIGEVCIEAILCLSLLGEFQKSADKVGVCNSGFNVTRGIGFEFTKLEMTSNACICELVNIKLQTFDRI